jgi:phage gpG-like protein
MVERFGGSGAYLSITSMPCLTALTRQLSTQAGQIRSMGPGAKHGSPLQDSVHDVIIPSVESNFVTRSDNGVKWREWNPKTPFMPYHKRYGPAKGILEVTGTLRRRATARGSWTYRGQQGEAFIPLSMMPAYATIQQEGGVNFGLDGYRGYIVARPFMDVSEEDVNRMQEIFGNWVDRIFGARLAGEVTAGAVIARGE